MQVRAAALVLTSLLIHAAPVARAQQAPRLVDGATLSLEGVLRLEQIRNNQYLVIQTSQAYEAIFDETNRKGVHQIQISLDGQSDSLKGAIGQKAVVSGSVVLNLESPSYFNGALIQARSVRLASGQVLLPQTRTERTSGANLTQFHTLIIFMPRAREQFTYKSWDAAGNVIKAPSIHVSCGLNGPGDVMNCFCPDGFAFTGTGKVLQSYFTKTADPQEGFTFAQFSLSDPVRNSFSAAVECTRQARH